MTVAAIVSRATAARKNVSLCPSSVVNYRQLFLFLEERLAAKALLAQGRVDRRIQVHQPMEPPHCQRQ